MVGVVQRTAVCLTVLIKTKLEECLKALDESLLAAAERNQMMEIMMGVEGVAPQAILVARDSQVAASALR